MAAGRLATTASAVTRASPSSSAEPGVGQQRSRGQHGDDSDRDERAALGRVLHAAGDPAGEGTGPAPSVPAPRRTGAPRRAADRRRSPPRRRWSDRTASARPMTTSSTRSGVAPGSGRRDSTLTCRIVATTSSAERQRRTGDGHGSAAGDGRGLLGEAAGRRRAWAAAAAPSRAGRCGGRRRRRRPGRARSSDVGVDLGDPDQRARRALDRHGRHRPGPRGRTGEPSDPGDQSVPLRQRGLGVEQL